MAEEERGPRTVETTVTTRLAPILRELRREATTDPLDRHEVDTASDDVAPAPVEPGHPPKIRFDASSVDRGFVVTRGTQIGKYKLEDKLGQGTFGSVYTARDTELERRVAFKVLNPVHQTNVEVVTRFLQEARATARINHGGIVTILDVGRVTTDYGEVAYIVMELLEGETLARRIDRCGRVAPAEAIEIGHQIAGALGAAHKADVLHRDVKPDNIFLVKDPVLAAGERVKVLDFGLAKLGRGGHTLANTILGTPRYMSPEQTRSSAQIDKRSDIYSLGCILFEMLTGRRPFEGDMSTLIERHQREIPSRVKTLVSGIPKSLDDLVARMLAKAPGSRPQTMAEVQKRLLESGAEVAVQPGRSSVDMGVHAPAPAVSVADKRRGKPERTKRPEKKPEVDARPAVEAKVEVEPKVEIDPSLIAASMEAATHAPATVVAFPPPPPPETVDPQAYEASANASSATVIVTPLAKRHRRRSLAKAAGVVCGIAVAAVAVVVVIARLADYDREPIRSADPPPARITAERPAPPPTPAPAPVAIEPAPTPAPAPAPAPVAIEPVDAPPAEPATVPPEEPVEPPPVVAVEPPVVEPPPPAPPRARPKLRKRPPVVRKRPPPPPTWDPNALFPKRPTK